MSVLFESIWKKNDSPDRLKAISLWDRFNTFPSAEVTIQRSKEIVFIAKENGIITGISTVRPAQIPLLNNNWFYEYRIFIAPGSASPTLMIPLTLHTKKLLEGIHEAENDKFIGMISIIQHEKMNTVFKRAVLPLVSMVFAGYNERGHQIRVSYFKGAKI